MPIQIEGLPSGDAKFEEFLRLCVEGLSHQVQGNSGPFLEMWAHTDDALILGAIGTYAKGWNRVRTHLLGASKRLDWTGLSVERLLTTVSDDLAVTVVLEHMTRYGKEEPESRTLRTTQVYRREDSGWRLVLRHANPVGLEDDANERALGGT